jgi:hypothetical protein
LRCSPSSSSLSSSLLPSSEDDSSLPSADFFFSVAFLAGAAAPAGLSSSEPEPELSSSLSSSSESVASPRALRHSFSRSSRSFACFSSSGFVNCFLPPLWPRLPPK